MPEGIKSAVRAIQVFEFFDGIRRESSVMEVSRALSIPQSSTSGLLRSLVHIGYLSHDAQRKTFVPTAKLTRLGAWVAPAISPDSAVITLMKELGEDTGATIILGALFGEVVRYIHVVPATTALRLHVGTDTTRPILTSGIGRLLLSTLPEERVREIVRRQNEAQPAGERRVSLAYVMRDLENIRAQGHSISLGRITEGAGVIAVALPVGKEDVQLALAIGGLASSIQSERVRYLKLMRRAIAAHLGGRRRAAALGVHA